MAHNSLACFAFCLLTITSGARATEFSLVREGQAASCIVLPEGAGPVERHAAGELALFLEKVTGAAVPIGDAPSKGLYPVYLGTAGAKSGPRSAAIDSAVSQLQDDGFVLAADADGLRIIANKPIGVLYGVYEVLKRQADLRWFAPGAEFEYCPKKPSVSVPGQVTVVNPSFPFRMLYFYCCHTDSKTIDSWDWYVRNGYNLAVHKNLFKSYPGEMEKRGAEVLQGASFNTLLGYDRLFDDHPEYYGLFDGKRLKMEGEKRQPCTTHPDVAAIMADSIKAVMDRPPDGGGCLIYNNDSTAWCRCKHCARLDPPDEQQKGFVGTRHFTLINQLAGRVEQSRPGAKLWTLAYQNFLSPPTGVAPDPRLSIHVCQVGRCYRHSMADEKCRANARFRDILAGWRRLHPSKLIAYEYSWCESPAIIPAYTPKERVYCQDLKYYHRLGLAGFKQTIAPPDGTYSPPWNTRHQTEAWHGEWPLLYLAGRLGWDIGADYDRLVEDMGSKYYGRAWPAMKPYREALIAMYEEGADHILGWGGTPHYVTGKCMAKPGVEARLLNLLDKAESLAAGDPALLKRVRRDREYFGLWWQSSHREYLDRAPPRWEVHARKRVDPLVLDGRFDEDDWKRLDYTTGFTAAGGRPADPQTFVKLLYDETNLYIAVEAMEPEPGRMKIKARKPGGAVALDNNLELAVSGFLSGNTVALAINPRGVIRDSIIVPGAQAEDANFESGAEVKTRVLEDRWVAEIRIPAAACGRAIRDWDVWKLNVVRNRRLGRLWNLFDGESQTSSWSRGAVRGPESLRPAVLGEPLLRNNGLEETAFLKNGDFEDGAVLPRQASSPAAGPEAPAHYAIHPETVTWAEGGAASGRRFLRIKTAQRPSAQIYQGVTPPDGFTNSLLFRAQVRGKGTLSCGGWLTGGRNIDSADWTPVEGVHPYEAGKPFGALVFQVTAGELDMDDITITQAPDSP